MRKIIVSIKIASTLERIGDHAENIANRIEQAKIVPTNYLTDSIYRLGQSVIKNLSQALTAYDQNSITLSKNVSLEDKKIDLLYETCFREHLVLMMEDNKNISYFTQMLFIAKELERIGDLCKNIAKEVSYSVEGKIS